MISLKFISSIVALIILVKGYSQNVTNPFETLKKRKKLFMALTIEELIFISIIPLSMDCLKESASAKKLRFKIGINGTPIEVGKFVDENGIIKKIGCFLPA